MSPLLFSKLLDARDRRRQFFAALRDLSFEFVKLKGDENEMMSEKGRVALSRMSSEPRVNKSQSSAWAYNMTLLLFVPHRY